MRITSIRSHLLSYPLPEALKLSYHGGERTILKRDAMLIRVETASGLIGYAPGQGSAKAKRIIDEIVAPFLAGRTLADPDALRVQFMNSAGRDPETRQSLLFRRNRPVRCARQRLEPARIGIDRRTCSRPHPSLWLRRDVYAAG